MKQSETKEPVKIDLIKEDGNFSSFSQAICILPTPFSWLSQGYYFIILASAPTKSIDLKAFRRTKNWNSIFLFDEVVHLIKLGTILPYPTTISYFVTSVPKKPFFNTMMYLPICILAYVGIITEVHGGFNSFRVHCATALATPFGSLFLLFPPWRGLFVDIVNDQAKGQIRICISDK